MGGILETAQDTGMIAKQNSSDEAELYIHDKPDWQDVDR